MMHLKKIKTSLAPKEEAVIHDAASILVQSNQVGDATASLIEKGKEKAIYDEVLFGKAQLRHQKEFEEMKSLTPDEHEVLLALLLLDQPVSFEKITTSLTQEEDNEDEDEDEEEEKAVNEKQHKRSKIDKSQVKVSREKNKKQREKVEKDDSEQTLRVMLHYKDNTPVIPSEKIFFRDPDAVGDCSKPIRKQLTESDVNKKMYRLMLKKEQVEKMMLEVLGKTEKLGTDGRKVSVYGPDGEIHEMMFKMWMDTPVLGTSEWNNFVRTYNLHEYQDFLTIWMFTHKKTRQICFAIDSTWFPVEKELSNRILKAAF